MTSKTVRAFVGDTIQYKVIKDGYKTVNQNIAITSSLPTRSTVEVTPSSETYTSDMTYTVDTTVEGEPLVNFSSFTEPDDTTCAAKTYCLMTRTTDGYRYKSTETETVRTYDNFLKIGSPTISEDHVVSGFSTSNYLRFGMPTYSSGTVNSFEIQFKLHLGTSRNPNDRVMNSTNSYDEFALDMGSNPCVNICGSSYTFGSSFTLDEDIWIKLVYENSTMKLYHSEDGINFTLDNSGTKTGIYFNSGTYDLGYRTYGSDSGTVYKGGIDLTESYVKINDSITWVPYTESEGEAVTTIYQGCIDPSAGRNDYTIVENYKCYQLQDSLTSDSLSLTKNSITGITPLYNQYIQQVQTPIRSLRWFYKAEPTRTEEGFYQTNCTITDHVASGFSDSSIFSLYISELYYPYYSIVFNIETGNMLQDCGIFTLSNYYESEAGCVVVGMKNKFENGKLLFGESLSVSTLREGTTTLTPNTKYWLGLSYTGSAYYVYLLEDDGSYTKDTLPTFTEWTAEGVINCSFTEYYGFNALFSNIGLTGAKVYDSSGTLLSSDADFYFEGGKLYLDNAYIVIGNNPAYTTTSNTLWQAYYYYDYIYQWMANKSLYTRTAHDHFADYLDFSRSYVNVSDTTWNQYTTPLVCMMPIDGGESDHTYIYKTSGQAVDYNTLSNLPTTILDNFNFEIYDGKLRNGIRSYNVSSGYSYGYFKITPSQDISVSVTASVSSESSWDYGACYIGTQKYRATRNQIKAKTTDGHGAWLFSISGTVASTAYTTTLLKDVTYYVQFYYAKDGSGNTNDDRIYIHSLSGFTGTDADVYTSIGCIATGSTDDGTAQSWDVYYPSDYSQPVLVNPDKTYSGGTKVDTISLPAHKTWTYQAGGIWTEITNE